MIIDRILRDHAGAKIDTDARSIFQKNIWSKIKRLWSRVLYLRQRATRWISYNCQDTIKWNGIVLWCALFITV